MKKINLLRTLDKVKSGESRYFGGLRLKQRLLTFLKNKKDIILPVTVVFCFPVLLYLQTLRFGFTYADDNEIIANNIAFLSDFRNVPQAFLTDASLTKNSHFYRPLQTLSYMADVQLSGGDNIWMYHLTNILLWGLIACSLFLLFRKFSVPLKLALLSTLIYCAHPLFISSVAWIPARGDLLLALFALLSFLFFIEHLQKKKFIYLFLHWLTFTIALFCKETAALLPLLFILYYFAFSFDKRFERKHLLNIVLYAVSGIIWFWLRSMATGNVSNRNDVGLRIFVSNLQTVPESLVNLFLPFDIALIPSFSLFKTLTGLGIIILIVVIFFINKERTKKEKVFCLSWFLVLLLPTLIIKIEFIDYLSHRLFLPLIGILLFALFSIPRKWLEEKDMKRKIALNGGYFCVLALLSSLTFIKSRSYSDPITFYNSAISQNPNNPLVFNNRGYVKENSGDFQGAIEDFTKAIMLSPGYAVAYDNRGIAYSAMGDLENAIKDFHKAMELNPNLAQAYFNRGNAYSAKGDLAETIKDYDKAIELNPNFALAYNNRGNTYGIKGDLQDAIKDYDKAIELNPDFALAYNDRGFAYSAIGDVERAIKDYDKAIGLSPNFGLAYFNRGNAHGTEGDLEEAIKDYDKTIELDPQNASAYNNGGNAYYDEGHHEVAIKYYDKAVELDPNYASAYCNRGFAYSASGDVEGAIKDYDKAVELNPNFALAYFNRGNAYRTKGDLEEAIKDYGKTIELNRNFADAYCNRGTAYKDKGMLKEAEQDFKMCEKLKEK